MYCILHLPLNMSNSKLNCQRSIYELSETGLEMAGESTRQSQVDQEKNRVWLNVIVIQVAIQKKQTYGKTKEQPEKLAGHEK